MDKPVGAVIMFGPPGAGKGTQAPLVGQRIGVPHISTGDMIRAEVASGSARGLRAGAVMARGELLSDDWLNEMVEARLQQPDCQRGFVLDGYPRTCEQAVALEHALGANGTAMRLILLAVDYNEIIRRALARRMCPVCGAIYNIYAKPPRLENTCDRDGAALVVRPDDREEVIRGRLEAYEKQTSPVLDYLAKRGYRMHQIDGCRRPEAVTAELLALLEAS